MQHVRALMASPAGVRVAHAAPYIAGATVSLLLVVLASRLALGPIHAVRDAAGCERAYADARTRTDSLSVTFLSFPDSSGHGTRHRCGKLRAAIPMRPTHARPVCRLTRPAASRRG